MHVTYEHADRIVLSVNYTTHALIASDLYNLSKQAAC